MSEKMELAAECQRVASYCIEQMPIYQAQDLLRKAAVALRASPAEGEEDDPTMSEEWNAGCDFAMTHLCKVLGVDPKSVTWDAATETLDGDVCAVIGNILREKYGEDWSPAPPRAAVSPPQREEVEAAIQRLRASFIDDEVHDFTDCDPAEDVKHLLAAYDRATLGLEMQT